MDGTALLAKDADIGGTDWIALALFAMTMLVFVVFARVVGRRER